MRIMPQIRMHAVTTGLIAALMFTISVKAQEITNTDWPNPNTVAFDEQAASTAGRLNPAGSARDGNASASVVTESSAAVQSKLSGEAGFVLGALSVSAALAMYFLANQKMRKARKT